LSGVLEKIIHQQHLNNFDIVVKVKTPANNININKLKKELAETLESLNNIK
jgi:RNase P protein component